MVAQLTCYPPLAQATVVVEELVHFTALLELSSDLDHVCSWQVALWHDGNSNGDWEELLLEEVVDRARLIVASASSASSSSRKKYYSGTIPRTEHPLHFTAKFKAADDQDWTWVNTQCGEKDGEIYFQTSEPISEQLSDVMQNLNPELAIHSVDNDAISIQLWSITTIVKAATGDTPGQLDIRLGTPSNFARWFSLVRISVAWLAPRQGGGYFSLHEDAVLCSFLLTNGLHLILLAVNYLDILTIFKSDLEGNIVVSIRNDGTEDGEGKVVAAVGKTFEAANAAVTSQAKVVCKELLGTGKSGSEGSLFATEESIKSGLSNNWYDGLTYCTWNGLGQNLTKQDILHALNALALNSINITNLIIDDQWQSVDNLGETQFQRGWTSFEAHKEGFPDGLKHVTGTIREMYPNIKHIAVWHGIMGYWGGFSATGDIAERYRTRRVSKVAEGFEGGTEGEITVVHEDDIHQMYEDFYSFLTSSGIDAVKTDTQYLLDCISSSRDRRVLIPAYQSAWTTALLRHFSTPTTFRAISSMSLFPLAIFAPNLGLPRKAELPRYMLRNSDDFFPDDPTSHTWHIFCNAHNAVLTQHLSVLLDWDMFQTVHAFSAFHAAARCLSGGPIYITDKPGRHDTRLIEQMTARNGEKTMILRTSGVGRAVSVYSEHAERRFCKVGVDHEIFVTHASGGNKSGKEKIQKAAISILGIFNMSLQTRTELIPLADFFTFTIPTSTLETQSFVLHSHSLNTLSNQLTVSSSTQLIPITLLERGFEILTLHPIHTVIENISETETMIAKVAVLGLVNPKTTTSDKKNEKQPKFTGCAAVRHIEFSTSRKRQGKLIISTHLKVLSDTLGLWVQKSGTKTEESGSDTRAEIILTVIDREKYERKAFEVKVEACGVNNHSDKGAKLLMINLESNSEAQNFLKATTTSPEGMTRETDSEITVVCSL